VSPTAHPVPGTIVGAMKMLRRAILALLAAAGTAGVLRLRGSGGVPPQHGGWRELSTTPK